MEHPEFEEKIPDDAEIVILFEDDEEFNKKAIELSEKSKEEGQNVIFIKTKGLAPVQMSRLINPKIELSPNI